jgi:hypothetical protein
MADNPGMVSGMASGVPPMGVAPSFDAYAPANDAAQELAGLDRRMRILEERFNNMRKRSQVDEQNSLKQNKKFQNEIRTVEQQLREVRVAVTDMQNKFKILINELRLYATKEEIKVLEKYVNMWEPVTFVSRKEVENMIHNIVEDEYNLQKPAETKVRNAHLR